MPLTEFDIIARYFSQATAARDDVALGIGDDAALINPPVGQQIAVAIDTLVAGVHFPIETDPYDIGWKALAVNLSDLAAMGATPAWFTLALTLEDADETWLGAFSRGLSDLALQSGVQLVGGDTTCGPLTVTIQAGGYVPVGEALTRRGAQAEDEVWVSGTPGDAALALQVVQGKLALSTADRDMLCQRLNRPQPRVQLGLALRKLANSCIDVSDGLLADLGHLCEADRLGAKLQYEALPLSAAAQQVIAAHSEYVDLPLIGGDDYELCFTASPAQHEQVLSVARLQDLALTRIGAITARPGIECRDQDGQLHAANQSGYRHFGATP